MLMQYGLNNEYCPGNFGEQFHVSSLPPNFTINGDLVLTDFPDLTLPSNLTVTGSLDLRGSGIKKLPSDLTVNGDLMMDDTSIEVLPNRLRVNGKLDLKYTSIASFGTGIYLKGVRTNASQAFTNPFKCERLHLTTSKHPEIDLRNVKAHTVSFNYDSKTRLSHIKNADCQVFSLRSAGCPMFHLSDSTIRTFRCSGSNTYLKLDSTTICETLNVHYVRPLKPAPIVLDITGSGIGTVNITSSGIDAPPIKLVGNFGINELNAHVVARLDLPDTGIVYQDMKVAIGTKIPDNFCCLGSITFE